MRNRFERQLLELNNELIQMGSMIERAIEMGISYVYTDKRSKGNGVALININQRIQLQFGREYGLSISSVLHKGTIVELTLPVEYEECPVS